MITLLSAKEARNTKIFAICYNGELSVEEMSLFEFVAESAEETTSPRGVMHKMFISEVTGVIYQLIGSDVIIDENDYNLLSDEDQELYELLGEATIKWQLREWRPNSTSSIVGTYDSENTADDEWYTRTYNYDFAKDDQRDTRYWYTREEAEAELQEMNKQ